MKNRIGQRYRAIHGVACPSLYVWYASKPMYASGTTSSALKLAPSATTAVGVPTKYRWCSVPSTPPDMKMMVANNTAVVADFACTSPRRVKMSAITAVANTSKKPSTHRCTSHQRQYSTSEMWVCSPHMSAAAKNRPMHTVERNNRPTIDFVSVLGPRSTGHSARPTSVSHSNRPTNRNHCQKRPMSAYSQPWWPHQKLLANPSFCITASHWPANEPTTMINRQVHRKLTPSRWNFGSCPDIAGAMYRPVPSHATAIHNTASCVCQVRVIEYGSTSDTMKP